MLHQYVEQFLSYCQIAGFSERSIKTLAALPDILKQLGLLGIELSVVLVEACNLRVPTGPAQCRGKPLNGITFFDSKTHVVQNTTSLVVFSIGIGFTTSLVANFRFAVLINDIELPEIL